MKKILKKIGRPVFMIDPERLRQLREDAKLTQQGLAEDIYKKLGTVATDLTKKVSYQRWEKTGKTSYKTAKAIAEVLGTTMQILQGGHPEAGESRLNDIEHRIYELYRNKYPPLVAGLDAFTAEWKTRPHLHISWGKDDAPEIESHVEQHYARELAEQLEVAQLSQDYAELDALATLLQWPLEELLRPVNERGHWLFVRSGLFGHGNEIFYDVLTLLSEVRARIEACMNTPFRETKILFKKQAPWFHIEISIPNNPEMKSVLRFVRCTVLEKGLLWSKPHWRDSMFIDELPKDVWHCANFIQGFNDAQCVPHDIRQLRLAVSRHIKPVDPEASSEQRTVFITQGCLDEYMVLLPRHEAVWEGHNAVTDWLAADIIEECIAHQLLDSNTLRYCTLKQNLHAITASLELPVRYILDNNIEPDFLPILSIALVEMLPDGAHRRVPWKDESMSMVYDKLQKSLARHALQHVEQSAT